MEPKIIRWSQEDIENLLRQFEKLDEITAFSSHRELSSKIASYGIFREIGTVNDELARFIFNVESQQQVRLESLKADLVEWNGLFGVKVSSTESQRLELMAKGFYDVVHPSLSVNKDGTFHSLYIFPEIINKIAASENVELVLVKTWGLNSIFGGFDPSKGYYQTNFWELENNDALKFADLIRCGKVAFLGTHDLIAHIAGIDQSHWPLLKLNAHRSYETISDYFKSVPKPNLSSLILPYTIGVVLDDLAQPPSYSSKNHIAVLNELLSRLSRKEIPAHLPTLLKEFPESFQNIIYLSRTPHIETKTTQIKMAVSRFIQDILNSSLINPI